MFRAIAVQPDPQGWILSAALFVGAQATEFSPSEVRQMTRMLARNGPGCVATH